MTHWGSICDTTMGIWIQIFSTHIKSIVGYICNLNSGEVETKDSGDFLCQTVELNHWEISEWTNLKNKYQWKIEEDIWICPLGYLPHLTTCIPIPIHTYKGETPIQRDTHRFNNLTYSAFCKIIINTKSRSRDFLGQWYMAGNNAIKRTLQIIIAMLCLNILNVFRTKNIYRTTHNNWLNNTNSVGYYNITFLGIVILQICKMLTLREGWEMRCTGNLSSMITNLYFLK